MKTANLVLVLACAVTFAACDRGSSGEPRPSASVVATSASAPVGANVAPKQAASASAAPQPIAPTTAIGEPAPEFELTDLEGKPFSLAAQRGKVVVLEWFNPSCPFVKAAHTKGSLVDAAARLGKQGVVYVAINSGAPGKQGHGAEVNQAGAKTFGLSHPVLLDETGRVGRLYGAARTPHVFVIDAQGRLAYRGAVDNSPDGEGQEPEGGKLVSYLERAVSEVLAGKPVSTPETKPYGCGVKYAD